MTRPVWIEAALNGPWSPDRQPLIPLSVEQIVAEGIACARAGAAIIHVHARDPETGVQCETPDTYAAIIEGIRAQVDCLVYPTLPLVGAPGHEAGQSIEGRFAAVEELARRGLLEWMVLDPGSVNFTHASDLSGGAADFIYLNPGEHVRAGLHLAKRRAIVPSYAVYEPGFLRTGAALAGAIGAPSPVYRFMFSSGFTWGYAPRQWALDAYLALLAEEAPGAPWMIAGLDVDILPLAEATVAQGGHLRVGLEDAPFGSELGNETWVQRAVAAVTAAGGRPASPDEVRAGKAV